ncbi:MAG: hypothetical protein JNL58_14475 [Planctomyces sp.]|nr:hypothetical protein [Planctomyces sp.]
MKTNPRRRKHLVTYPQILETLEERALLTGDVAVIQQGDTLRIQGDHANNSLYISGDAETITVVGLNNTETTINGSLDPVQFTNIQRIEVEGKAGNDAIVAFFLNSGADDLLISGGDGHDAIDVWTNSGVSVQIDSGSGADLVSFTSASAYGGGGNVSIVTADGDDELSMDLLQHQGNIDVDMGNGNDRVRATIREANGDLSIDGGNGSDDVTIRPWASYYGGIRVNLILHGGNGQKDSLFVQPSLIVYSLTEYLGWENQN